VGVTAILCILISCQKVPLTKRNQLHLVPESQLQALSYQEYDSLKATSKTESNTPDAQMVNIVSANIEKAVEVYMKSVNLSSRLKGFKWESHLFVDTQINAWCMPGGKIGVYTGILPYTKNDTGMAVVLGHEISHAVAQHGDERMSELLLVNLGGIALAEALSKQPQATRQLALAAFGLGAQVGYVLPYSRLQESEADRLGLIFMSMAGYDPHAAIPFWERMMNASKGQAPPPFLSDHPTDASRIANIRKLIPEAMKYYKKAT